MTLTDSMRDIAYDISDKLADLLDELASHNGEGVLPHVRDLLDLDKQLLNLLESVEETTKTTAKKASVSKE